MWTLEDGTWSSLKMESDPDPETQKVDYGGQKENGRESRKEEKRKVPERQGPRLMEGLVMEDYCHRVYSCYALSGMKQITEKDYHPIKDATFNMNEPLPFSFLCNALDKVAECSGSGSKDKKITIMSNVFRTFMLLSPEELPSLYYFCTCRIGPPYI